MFWIWLETVLLTMLKTSVRRSSGLSVKIGFKPKCNQLKKILNIDCKIIKFFIFNNLFIFLHRELIKDSHILFNQFEKLTSGKYQLHLEGNKLVLPVRELNSVAFYISIQQAKLDLFYFIDEVSLKFFFLFINCLKKNYLIFFDTYFSSAQKNGICFRTH